MHISGVISELMSSFEVAHTLLTATSIISTALSHTFQTTTE